MSLRQAMQQLPDIAELSRNIIMETTPEGLNIQLVDQDGRPTFENGSNQPMPYTKKLLAAVGSIVATV